MGDYSRGHLAEGCNRKRVKQTGDAERNMVESVEILTKRTAKEPSEESDDGAPTESKAALTFEAGYDPSETATKSTTNHGHLYASAAARGLEQPPITIGESSTTFTPNSHSSAVRPTTNMAYSSSALSLKTVTSPIVALPNPYSRLTKSSAPRHGISLRYVRERLQGSEDKSMYTICQEFVLPETASMKRSLADHLKSSTATSIHVKGIADVFVSYAWTYKWGQIAEALESNGFAEAFIWMDLFVLNQHDAIYKELEYWLETFSTAIQDIGKIAIVLAPWRLPTHVTRAWCVFEIMAALDANVERIVVLPPSEEKDFQRSVLNNEIDETLLNKIFADINVNRCSAREESERDAILKLIGKRSDVNDTVMLPLKEAFIRMAESVVAVQSDGSVGASNALSATAQVYQAQGRLDESAALWQRALDESRQAGDTEIEVAAKLNHFASVLELQNKLHESANHSNQALEIRRRVLGDNHPDVANTLNNLASVLRLQGKLQDALIMHTQALDIRRRSLVGKQSDVAQSQSLTNIALINGDMGNLEKAIRIHQEALVLRDQALGENHPDTARTRGNLARALWESKRFEEALPVAELGLESLKTTLGPKHWRYGFHLNTLAAVHHALGHREDATKMRMEADEVMNQTIPQHAWYFERVKSMWL